MKERFRDARAGDPVSARTMNRLYDVAEAFANSGPVAGGGAFHSKDFKGQLGKDAGLLVVRLDWIIPPENSAAWIDLQTRGYDPATMHNATVLVWDAEAQEWADDPTARMVTVSNPDSTTYFRPLVADAVIPVGYDRASGKYFPLFRREQEVVQVTGPEDAEGFYPAVILAFDSETQAWQTVGDCWLIDAD
jgi:hypothetical protein